MPYTILEAKIRLPHAKKTTQLLNSFDYIKIAHPTLKNYYLISIPEHKNPTQIIDEYTNIGKLRAVGQIEDGQDCIPLHTMIEIAHSKNMKILMVNDDQYYQGYEEAELIDDRDKGQFENLIYEQDIDTGDEVPINEAAKRTEQEKQRDTSNSNEEEHSALHSHIICQGQTFSAKLDYTSAGFHIRFGSRLRKDVTASWKGTAAYKQRAQLIKDGILTPKGKHLIMMADYLCKSPSTAASMIRGASSNGWTALKYADGSRLIQGKYTYREFDEISG